MEQQTGNRQSANRSQPRLIDLPDPSRDETDERDSERKPILLPLVGLTAAAVAVWQLLLFGQANIVNKPETSGQEQTVEDQKDKSSKDSETSTTKSEEDKSKTDATSKDGTKDSKSSDSKSTTSSDKKDAASSDKNKSTDGKSDSSSGSSSGSSSSGGSSSGGSSSGGSSSGSSGSSGGSVSGGVTSGGGSSSGSYSGGSYSGGTYWGGSSSSDGSGEGTSSGSPQALNAANDLQITLVESAKSTKATDPGLAAKWVENVYANAGFGSYTGNSCDLFRYYCYYSNRSELKVGMIVAVPSHTRTTEGKNWGHVCIYIGDGQVMDCVGGVVRTKSLDEWISYYGTTYTPKWGWLGDIDIA